MLEMQLTGALYPNIQMPRVLDTTPESVRKLKPANP